MLAIVHLTPATCCDTISLAALARLAARHELVLVCPHQAAINGLIPALRRTLQRHWLVALVVDGEVRREERELVQQVLEEGNIPLILTTGDVTAGRPMSLRWIGADTTMVLPTETDAVAA